MIGIAEAKCGPKLEQLPHGKDLTTANISHHTHQLLIVASGKVLNIGGQLIELPPGVGCQQLILVAIGPEILMLLDILPCLGWAASCGTSASSIWLGIYVGTMAWHSKPITKAIPKYSMAGCCKVI